MDTFYDNDFTFLLIRVMSKLGQKQFVSTVFPSLITWTI